MFNIPNTHYARAGRQHPGARAWSAFFNNEFEIARFTSTKPAGDRDARRRRPRRRPAPSPAPTSRREAYDGQFVRLSGLLVISVGNADASGAYNVVTTAPDGTSLTVRIDASPVGIVNTFWQVGHDATTSAGAALNFSTNGTTFTPEVKPRSPADVVATNPNLMTIADARAISERHGHRRRDRDGRPRDVPQRQRLHPGRDGRRADLQPAEHR